MAQVELILPKMGESVVEATITSWHKNEGDTVEMDEIIMEVATDKVDNEVPSTAEGVLVKMLFNEGDVVPVGAAYAIISTDGEVGEPVATPAPQAETVIEAPAPVASNGTAAVVQAPVVSNGNGTRFYSPLVKSIAAQENIAVAELETIPGTGSNGRVTKKDILAYVANRGTAPVAAPAPASAPVASPAPTVQKTEQVKPAASYSGNVEIVEMDRMRKLIADHMIKSKQTSAHVTSMVEVDMTNIVLWRNKIKNEFLKREGEKITFTPIFVEAVAKAVKDFPNINCSVDGSNIILKKDINIGMATALPSGNLIVPVIKNADHKNLIGLAKNVNDLANRARNNKLSPDDIQGGTFTLTNVGTFGNVMGTPIINQPEVAIMSTGVIQKKPAVIETELGDTIGIRHMMFLSMSYDHRVVDGMLGGSFVKRVADYLESFDVNRDIW